MIRIRLLARTSALPLLLVVAACASAPTGENPASGGPDRITQIEVESRQWSNAYAMVRDLRPQWVRTRGIDSFVAPGNVQVYLDGVRLGDVELLRSVPTVGIHELEWIDPVAAAGRWGLDHSHGVISISFSPDRAPAQD